MCLLCPSSSASVLCHEHEREWETSPEHLRVEAFRKANDPRLHNLHRSALSDFVYRTLAERQNSKPEPKP